MKAPSSAGRQSGAFDKLDARIQEWIWRQRWPALRPAQEQAVEPILGAQRDVVICAATAAGKTEAAFLPICSRLLRDRDNAASPPPSAADGALATANEASGGAGIKVLYVSPLKALINDQWGRLDGLCDHLDIPVHRWHGDVNAAHKTRLLKNSDGILIITPESLEAMLVNRGTTIRPLMQSLRYIVIDELHAFLGTQRGAQLQSQLHRLELATRRRIPRIALSATLGDLSQATRYLRPTGPQSVNVILDHGDGAELRMQLRGYERQAVNRSPSPAHGPHSDDEDAPDVSAIAAHLFDTLRGSTNLVFANRRGDVEEYADKLARLADARRVPNEFFPHHGSLSRSAREDVETLLRSGERPTTVVCTSTLELGIDIGSVSSVAQLGAPPSVASLRQRLGRSGRRAGEAATLRMYVTEEEISEQSSPTDTIRPELVQTIAMIDLLFEKWFEPLDGGELNLSTLIQQLLSLIAQHSGVRPQDAYTALCGPGPFQAVTTTMFGQLLRDIGQRDLITQAGDGLLLPGGRGERLINHYSFYSAFSTPEEYRLIAGGNTIGSMPISYPIEPGTRLIFSGRRWQVTAVDDRQRVIELARSSGGRPPRFSGAGSRISVKVHHYMLRRYLGNDIPRYLDSAAQRLLAEGRDYYRRWRLHHQPAMRSGSDILLFPWEGDRTHDTLALLLTRHGISACREGVAINASAATVNDLRHALQAITEGPLPIATDLAVGINGAASDKNDVYLGDGLLAAAYAARALDVPAALDTARRLLAVLTPDNIAERPAANPPASLRTLDTSAEKFEPTIATRDAVFSVVDVETTGFSPALGDRIVEIGIVRLAGDGTILDTFETLINPQRPMKATFVHGITDTDIENAPTFADIAHDIAEWLAGTVVTAHNAPFDVEFLAAELGRLGRKDPISATACTLQLAHRFLPNLASHKLDACAAAEGVTLERHHSALADASAAAALLTRWLRRARQEGAETLADLQIATPDHPTTVSASIEVPRRPLTVRSRLYAARPDARDTAAAVVPSIGGQLYELALAQALADGDVTDIERRELDLLAAQWNLTATEQERLLQAATRQSRPATPPA